MDIRVDLNCFHVCFTFYMQNFLGSSKGLTFLTNVNDSETPKNGIESLLQASALTNKLVE